MATMELTRKAITIATDLHKDQTRRGSGLPYIVHPTEVLSIVKKFKESHNIDNICAAAVLHDTIEDCGYTRDDITREFSTMTALLVSEVTNDPTELKILGKEAYINHKLETMTSYALVIKLADILANLTDQPTEAQIDRLKAHRNYLLNTSRRVLSDTHKRLLDQIGYSLKELYGK